jgi:hypothetical protein
MDVPGIKVTLCPMIRVAMSPLSQNWEPSSAFAPRDGRNRGRGGEILSRGVQAPTHYNTLGRGEGLQ